MIECLFYIAGCGDTTMDQAQSLSYFLFNVVWMSWNLVLAWVAIVLANIAQKTRTSLHRIMILIVWMLFVPNTLYLVTDVIHVFNQRFSMMTPGFISAGIVWYALIIALGPYTLYRAVRPVLDMYRSDLRRFPYPIRMTLIAIFASAVGFAIAIGRFQRTNSWYVFTQPMRVFEDIMRSFTEPVTIGFALCYGVGAFVITAIAYAQSE